MAPLVGAVGPERPETLMPQLHCPRCGLSLAVRAAAIAAELCARCIGRAQRSCATDDDPTAAPSSPLANRAHGVSRLDPSASAAG